MCLQQLEKARIVIVLADVLLALLLLGIETGSGLGHNTVYDVGDQP